MTIYTFELELAYGTKPLSSGVTQAEFQGTIDALDRAIRDQKQILDDVILIDLKYILECLQKQLPKVRP